MNNKKKGSIFIYILLLINVVLLIGYFVFNNIFILDNNISVGNNAEEVFTNIYDNGNVNINTVRLFNSNGNGYNDSISCPTNVTMSGTTSSGTSIFTSMVYKLGSIYCEGNYNGNEFRIYFNDDFSDFDKAYYMGSVVNLISTSGTLGTANIASNSTVTSTTEGTFGIWPFLSTYYASNSIDGDYNSRFESEYRNSEWLNFDFGSDKSVGLIKIYKNSNSFFSNYWNNATIKLLNSIGTVVSTGTIVGVKNDSYIEVDFKYRGLVHDIRSVKIETENVYLDIEEFEVYELLSTSNIWEGDNTFIDSDNTLISFDETGLGGNDGIDDDLNSDNYRVTSSDRNYYANGYQDDDVIPRLFVFGNIDEGQVMYNIYWNNYKTLEFVDNNINNNDILNIKLSNVEDGLLYLDMFSPNDIIFDIKIIEFDSYKYEKEFTLLPLKSFKATDLNNYIGYIQNNSGTLDLSTVITGNEYIFDFKNKDYAIFITNKTIGDISFRLNGVTQSGTGIYINPIDDSFVGTIKTLNNNMIIGEMEENFIGENFIVVGTK